MADSPDPSNAAPDTSAAPDTDEISWWLLAAFALHMAAIALATIYARSSEFVWFAYAGIYYAQVCLLGIWLGIGTSSIYLRLGACCLLLAGITCAYSVAGWPDLAGLARLGVMAMLAVAAGLVSIRKMGGRIVRPAPADVPISTVLVGAQIRDLLKILLYFVGAPLLIAFLSPGYLGLVFLRLPLTSLIAVILILTGWHGASLRAMVVIPAYCLIWGYLEPFRQGADPAVEQSLWVMSAYSMLLSLTLLAIRWAGYRFLMVPHGLDSPALRMLDAGDCEGARRALAVAVQRLPDSPATWYAQARLAIEDGNLEQALEAIQDVLAVMPDALFALVCRYTIYSKLEDYERAESDLTRMMELKQVQIPAAMLYNDRGVARMKRNNGEGAIADLSEALRLGRNMAIALRNRASVYSQACQFEKALQDVEAALIMEPNQAGAWNNRAWCLAIAPDPIRDPVRALADARKAMELIGEHSNRPVVISTLAAALAAVGDFPAAIESIEEALAGTCDTADRIRMLEMQAAFQAGKPYTPKPAFVLP